MTAPSQPPELSFRAVADNDRWKLENFSCSQGEFYEDEVERFVREVALEQVLKSAPLYRLLTVFEGKRLVAVAGHHPEGLIAGDGHGLGTVDTARLQVLALSLEDQGRRLPDGRRVSNLVIETLMHDALAMRENAILTAVVARENLRCLALLERYGLRSQVEYDARHIRVSGYFTKSA